MADIDPQKTAAAPQKTAAAPQKTAAAPQSTAAAPQSTAAAPGKFSDTLTDGLAGPGSPVPPGSYGPGDTVTVGGKSYTVEKSLGSGAEGDIYVVTDGARRYALKLCHPGYHVNSKVMPALQTLKGKNLIADVIDYGDDFELLEYIPGGSAAHAGIKGNAEAISTLVLNTAIALDELHKAGVLHKDVKPANILIRDTTTWDSVLCDFGIADILDEDGKCATLQVRTPIYAAPEIYSETINLEGQTISELTPKSDFYSLGMTIISLWVGEDAFLSERKMAMDKVKGRIAIPPGMPDKLERICRGLLIRNPAKRWNLDEIQRTVDGEDIPVEEDEIIEDLNITYNASKHMKADTPEELADCMEADEDTAIKYLYRGQIEKWLQPYPELVLEMQDIVETRYPKDQRTGLYAAIYLLDPSRPFPLSGVQKDTGDYVSVSVADFKGVGDFFNLFVPDRATMEAVSSNRFTEWVRARNKSMAAALPTNVSASTCAALRVQTLDPLSDIILCNKPDDPGYAMTQEGIGRVLNTAYNVFWNICGGDISAVPIEWSKAQYAPLNRHVPAYFVLDIAASFLEPDEFHYITDFFKTKGDRFSQQQSWLDYCIDYSSREATKKAGPTDDVTRAQIAWMKVIKGFGVEPEYEFAGSGEKVTTRDELFAKDKALLKEEYEKRGLRGWLAVQHQEDPNADLSEQYAYENLLLSYLADVEQIDENAEPVERFYEAQEEADRIISTSKGKIRGHSVRSVVQHVLTVVLAIIPALLLLTMLICSIIEHPVLDMQGLNLEKFFWPIGLLVAGIVFFTVDDSGCLTSCLAGVVASVIIFFVTKFLGALILYIFTAILLAVLVFFCIKTVFFRSPFARDARRFNKPGFEERYLEPLYYAFSDELRFDSSLNGTFDQDKIQSWNLDLKQRRTFIILFVVAVWVLVGFSFLVPKSERFQKFSAPFIERITTPRTAPAAPVLLDFESLEPGSKGEQVIALQTYLKEAGYLKGLVDGDYGKGTRTAVTAFQKANGLEATGVADQATIQKINQLHAESLETQE